MMKSSIILVYMRHWGFRLDLFSSTTIFLSQSNFHVFFINDLGVHLEMGGGLLVNSDPEQTTSSLSDSIECLRCCPVMHTIFPRLIRSGICLDPYVPYSDAFCSPRRDESPKKCLFVCYMVFLRLVWFCIEKDI